MRAMEECKIAWLMNGTKYEVKYDFAHGEFRVYKDDEFDWSWTWDETQDVESAFEEIVNRAFYPQFVLMFDAIAADIKLRIREQVRIDLQDQADLEREYRESRGL